MYRQWYSRLQENVEICRKTQFRKIHRIFSLVCLLGIALTVDVFWASRSSSSTVYSSIASNWPREKRHVVVVPKAANDTDSEETVDDKAQKNRVSERHLSATFADIPAPELEWEQMPSAPVPRLDGSAVQIKDLLYVFSGYGTLEYVHSHVDIYNFTDNTWSGRLEAPKDMANSHLGVATDGRYVYVVAGQSGPQCRTPPTSNTFVLDTETGMWERFAPLPAPRYAPATQIWKGRLHVMGGSKENRHTPGTDHWSIAVKDGKAIEKEWRNEIPIPRGGPHRACVNVGDELYVIGGQEGDFMPKPGSPNYKCSRRNEVHALIISHSASCNFPRNPVLTCFLPWMLLQQWSVIGRLPYRVKTTLAAFWDGWMYLTSGQRDRGPDNPQPKKVVGEMWRTKLKL
ncbi:UNVERIFIED_CONTAM: Kelch repeat-containing protein [Sesamum radiatum]|uniref:Kelch repeat-containing protein n=1 Tax=Sesamum radiatum TaxID=300843 RepID=A0AAW2RBN7_SESRA